MLTEKDYCDYETCVALKELGYKVPPLLIICLIIINLFSYLIHSEVAI